MSQVSKRVCDKCGKEIVDKVDSGYIHIDYSNSIGYMQTVSSDFCANCMKENIDSLRDALKNLFSGTEDTANELEDFFSQESKMIESMKKAEEEAKKEQKEDNETTTDIQEEV